MASVPLSKMKISVGALTKFKKAMEHIYGPFETLTKESAQKWIPKDLTEGYKGRYLWTDGFAVVNFLTLFKETGDRKYLVCGERLIHKVHDVLGYTRDEKSRLPGATDDHPLLGGLRIGKIEESGEDGDGQYFHYLTVWMFALLQMSAASDNLWYIRQSIELAKTVHPKFMINRESNRPRMFWKMSMDLSHPLVQSEGNLDPIDGYVIYSLLQKADPDSSDSLRQEIHDYEKILNIKWPQYHSTDTLDLGMTLWTIHWFTGEAKWADSLTNTALKCLDDVTHRRQQFDRPLTSRLAFREFGTVLGIRSQLPASEKFSDLAEKILETWEKDETVPIPASKVFGRTYKDLDAINCVMYATALYPGAFTKDYWKTAV